MSSLEKKYDVKYFEDFSVGDTTTIVRSFSREDVDAYGALLGDYNPVHFDEAFAQKTPFKRCVVHGKMIDGLVSTIAGMKLPGAGTILFDSAAQYPKPLYIGEIVTMRATISELLPKEKYGLLKLTVIAFVGEKTIMVGSATVSLPYRHKKTAT